MAVGAALMNTIHQREFDRQRMIFFRESLFDLDIVVDDARREVDGAVARLQSAVARRDDVARQLKQLFAQVAA